MFGISPSPIASVLGGIGVKASQPADKAVAPAVDKGKVQIGKSDVAAVQAATTETRAQSARSERVAEVVDGSPVAQSRETVQARSVAAEITTPARAGVSSTIEIRSSAAGPTAALDDADGERAARAAAEAAREGYTVSKLIMDIGEVAETIDVVPTAQTDTTKGAAHDPVDKAA